MANTSKKKSTKLAAKESLADVIDFSASGDVVDLNNTSDGRVNIDDYAVVNVKSNVFGHLLYIDKKTGEEIVWHSCGEVIPVSFAILRNMRSRSIDFFKNQWVIPIGFADENSEKYTPADIFKALYITQYYKEYVDPANYEEICTWSPDEIRERVALMGTETKENLAIALNLYIDRGVLDSRKCIKAFEEALGCELRGLD